MTMKPDLGKGRHLAKNVLGLLFWILLTFGVAAFASQFEPGEWYTRLAKPSWTPPGWVFGPVWGILYMAMSVSAWLVWRQRKVQKTIVPLGLYIGQLALNGLWSWLFFGRHLIGTALIDLLVLLAAVAAATVVFRRISAIAAMLLIPYLLWLFFAAVLNLQIWRMN